MGIKASKAIVPTAVLALLLYVVGSQWDVLIHTKQRHTLLATPHLIILGAFIAYGLCAFFAALTLLKTGSTLNTGERRNLKIILLILIIFPAALIDELWHRIFGVDMTAWSFPHLLIFFGMASALLGLTAFIIPKSDRGSKKTKCETGVLTVIFLASLFFIMLFVFIDFDVPAYSTLNRPAPAYPIVESVIIIFLSLLATQIVRRRGTATIASFTAWSVYTATGLLVGSISINAVSPQIFPPFPLFIPILALELCMTGVFSKKVMTASFKDTIIPVFLAMSACYLSIAFWAEFYTKLPQQTFADSKEWFLWYLALIPIASITVTWLAKRFANWIRAI